MTREEFEKSIGHPVTDNEILDMKNELSYIDFVDYANAINWEVSAYDMYIFVRDFEK